jgi:hypothetical protein
VQDESLIDEMRETLRADRERAVNRRREHHAAQPAAEAEAEAGAEPEARPPGLLSRLAKLPRRR